MQQKMRERAVLWVLTTLGSVWLFGCVTVGEGAGEAGAPAPETSRAAPVPSPRIIFTEVPGPGEGPNSRGNIAGRVEGVESPQSLRIVVYSHTDKWYVQPLTASPKTAIDADGNWSNWTHLGYRYAALLVRPDFAPDDQSEDLPQVGGKVLAREETSPSGQ